MKRSRIALPLLLLLPLTAPAQEGGPLGPALPLLRSAGFEVTHADPSVPIVVARRTDVRSGFADLLDCPPDSLESRAIPRRHLFTLVVTLPPTTGGDDVIVIPRVRTASDAGTPTACETSAVLETRIARAMGEAKRSGRPGGQPVGVPPADDGLPPDTYFEFQVDLPVMPAAGNPAPVYPAELRDARVKGEVLVQFIVDARGRAVPGSIKVLRSSHQLFTEAVQEVLPRMRFASAVLKGRKVRQVVQMPFVFSVAP